MAFWTEPRRGANYFAAPMNSEWIEAAQNLGIGWVRLAFNIWPTESRDFLLGDADQYDGLVPEDLALVRSQLDLAAEHELPIVLTTLSLPGTRWRQHNDFENDHRLWESPHIFRPQAVAFWADLVDAVGDHPALVAVNVLNEPRPRRHEAVNPFYDVVLTEVRRTHPELPMMFDAPADASPEGFPSLTPLDDPAGLYDLHLYEPWDFVNWRRNQGRYPYPGNDGNGRRVDREYLSNALDAVRQWQTANGVEAHQMVLGEFGIDRRIPGAERYLADVIDLAEARGWHWAFYAFRDWQALDYELGPDPLPRGYHMAWERGEPMTLERVPNPMIDVIREGLRGEIAQTGQSGEGSGK